MSTNTNPERPWLKRALIASTAALAGITFHNVENKDYFDATLNRNEAGAVIGFSFRGPHTELAEAPIDLSNRQTLTRELQAAAKEKPWCSDVRVESKDNDLKFGMWR